MNSDVGGRGDPGQGPTTDEGVPAPITTPPPAEPTQAAAPSSGVTGPSG